jgi:hypothetical protein
LHGCFEEGSDPLDRSRPRVAAVAEVEHEPGVAHRIPAESGWGGAILAKIFFNFFEQVH